ncbi:hypothetical protein D1159_02230 [Pseudoflavonifractor sp. 524-17]|uniref:DUF5711 family protein n=1 Tax=Pseudoflavonifractor sp. 524-17 TaxID=2304577 RepID=UPI001379603E|nr:DUF5711 family protein [Pseudoflavonifractor sp. 524-17]NCE63424.1 hypothetical protein [Pseudoflavonifractor sp. 524-17]
MELLEPKSKPQKRKPPLLFRLLAFLLTLALVLGAMFLVVNRDRFNMDSLRRWFQYRTLERNESGLAESFPYSGGSTNSFATLNNGLLVSSPQSIQLYSGDGTLLLDQPVSMDHPVIDSNTKTALVYDAGGTSLYVFSGGAQQFSLSLREGESFLSARLNDAGEMVVVAQQSGFKGTATVYDNSFAATLRVKLSSRFILDAALSPDGRSMVLLTIGTQGSQFDTQAEFYRLSRTEEDIEPDAVCSLGSDVSLGLRWTSGGVWVLGENSLSILDADGTVQTNYSYSGRYLKGFSLDGDGYAALLLGKYRAGSTADLVVVDEDGQTASYSLGEQVFSLSAAGKYIALLSAGRLDIFRSDLTPYRSLEITQGARRVIQRSDGSTMLMNANTAHLYIPE